MSAWQPVPQLVPRTARFVVGILIAPPLVGAGFGILYAATIGLTTGGIFGLALLGATYGAILGAVIGWPIASLFGVIAHQLLLRRGWTGRGHYMLAAAACSVIPMPLLLVFAWATNEGSSYALAQWAVLMPVIFVGSAIAGLVFWLIRRPDRDLTPPPSPQT